MKKITAILVLCIFLISIGAAYAADGDVLWAKSYNGGGNDTAYGVATDSQNNVIVTGELHDGSNNDYYTIKYQGSAPTRNKSLPIVQILKILKLYPKE
ncbi:MAG: hypothetical protein AMQ74_00615 [Candidatus Methanofastidiosum methylothiophilum]|uniref:Uncharacterized protein n=1 Tax=Candidatus Methanofastidiosum methylothiophilum TaxID=1705564 RepID=A0A150J6C4_9EURY|nr:MAG: hypothetical protein AMQ74_00615 [Candidatus Methanofastidiosum methylthiophilus]NMC76401.1 hypothetical protein [Candidatus Methanofastidiosa archaeon]